MSIIKKIQNNFGTWNRKTAIAYDNKQYKIIGCGKQAFKVLKFEPQPELENKGGWSQVFWNYKEITPESIAFKVIEKMESMM